MTKFNLGDEVEVNFIGRITKIELSGEDINYKVEGKGAWGLGLTDDHIFTLPTPEDFKSLKSGD